MVSGGTVTGDLSSLKSCFQSYNSEVEGLSGSWKGLSYDNLVAKVNEFFYIRDKQLRLHSLLLLFHM